MRSLMKDLSTSRREYEKQVALEEAEELRSFHDAVAARSSFVHELKDSTPVTRTEVAKPGRKRNQQARMGNIIITVKPQAKKAKTEPTPTVGSSESTKPSNDVNAKLSPDAAPNALMGLVSYSDESEEDN